MKLYRKFGLRVQLAFSECIRQHSQDDSEILFQFQKGIALRVLVRTVGTVTDLRVLPAFCEYQDHFYELRNLERYCQTEKLAITTGLESDIVRLVKSPLRITIGPESDIVHLVNSPLRTLS